MKGKKGKEESTLRQRAEERLAERETGEPAVSGVDQIALVHELQVHQIELEMQNEELRRSQQEAEEQRRRYQDLYDFAPVGYLTLDATGKVTEANLAAASLLGCERHRLVGSPLFVFIAPESRGEFDSFLSRLLAGASGSRCEVRLGANARRQGWLLIEGGTFSTGGETGQLVRLALMDITERRMAEDALRREKTFTDTVANSMPGIFYVFDDQRQLVRWNRRFEEFSGHSRAEMPTMRPHDFVAVEDHELLESKLREVLIERRNADAELLLLDRDGRKVPFYCTGSPMTVGDTTYLIGMGIDISERVQAEEALRESEERFRAIFDQAAVGIGHVDPDGNWVRINRKYCDIVGYPEEEFKALTFKDITHPDDLETSMKHFRLMQDGKLGNYSLEKRYIRKDGSIVWVNLTASMVTDTAGNPKFAVGIIEDITVRKRAEAEIERLNTDLAARAADLEAANKELEAFNFTVAHDLRKPLTTINGYCQILRELCGNKLDEQCTWYLKEAYDGTWRMNRLIDTLLNFSSISRKEPRRERVDLSATAQTVAAELKLAEPSRRVTFRIAGGISVIGDAGLLQVVMENLLGNAWKYTAGLEEAVIEFGATERGGAPVYFVRDNGIGFSAADEEKLFIPFQRLPGAQEYKGFGIGLATVERIVQRHGGKVWAEGTPGKGATFYFMLGSAMTA